MAFCWAKKCRDNTVQLPNLRYCDHECSKHKLILKPGFQVAILQATPWAIPYLLSSYRVRTHPRLHLAIPRWTWLVDAWSSCDLVVRKSTESANLIPSWAWWQLHRSPTRRCCPPMAISCCLFFFNGQIVRDKSALLAIERFQWLMYLCQSDLQLRNSSFQLLLGWKILTLSFAKLVLRPSAGCFR